MITVPLNIENHAKSCVVELRRFADGSFVAQFFAGILQPGIHMIECSSEIIGEPIDAGWYVVRVVIDDDAQNFPIRYMP